MSIPIYCTINKVKDYPINTYDRNLLKNTRPTFEAKDQNELEEFRKMVKHELLKGCRGKFENFSIRDPRDNKTPAMLCHLYFPKMKDVGTRTQREIESIKRYMRNGTEDIIRDLIRISQNFNRTVIYCTDGTLPPLHIYVESESKYHISYKIDRDIHNIHNKRVQDHDLGFRHIHPAHNEVKDFVLKIAKLPGVYSVKIGDTFMKDKEKEPKGYSVYIYSDKKEGKVIGKLVRLIEEPYDRFVHTNY